MWIKLDRKLLEWEWHTEPAMISVWIHLLLKANYKATKWKGLEIDCGEVVIGLSEFANEVGISIQKLRTCLSRLERSGTISKKSTSKGTIVKVLNYSLYQGCDTAEQQTNNKQITNEQQTNNNYYRSKEVKNNIYINNIINSDFQKVVQAYNQNIGVITPLVKDKLTDLTDNHSADLVVYAIEEAVNANARSIKYIEGIFRHWDNRGVKTVDDALLAATEHRSKKADAVSAKKTANAVSRKKNSFIDYDDNDVKDFELELMQERIKRNGE